MRGLLSVPVRRQDISRDRRASLSRTAGQASFRIVILETALADALYLSWAIPAEDLPPLPPTLRYDTVLDRDRATGFFSLVLFRQVGLHLRGASWLGLSYPQVNARLYVRDGAGVPAVLLERQLAPAWVVPVARAVARQPLSGAILDFPAGGATFDGVRRWRIHAGAGFEATARPGASPDGAPRLGKWHQTAAFFRERSRAYWRIAGGELRGAETEHPAADIVPMTVEIVRANWLETFLEFAPLGGSWGAPHSAFLVPEVRLAFAMGARPEPAVAPQVAAIG
jgi:uncharacterized protein YqjF (DUF2071 family)